MTEVQYFHDRSSNKAIIKNGAEISEKHIGSDGVHRDESTVLRLDGKK